MTETTPVTHETRPHWTKVAWPYNNAIKIPCWQNGKIILHVAFERTDIYEGGCGEWKEGEGFEYSVRGSHSGRCPEHIKTLEEAMDWLDNPQNR